MSQIENEMLEKLGLEPRFMLALEVMGMVDKKSISDILNEAVDTFSAGWTLDQIDAGRASGIIF
jgi:hypothetical protein